MFITVVAYWNCKFHTVEDPAIETMVVLGDETEAPECGSEGGPPNDLQKAWGGYLAVASMVPNVTFLILNGVVGHKFRTLPRLLVSLVLVILMFTFTSIMVQIDTDSR